MVTIKKIMLAIVGGLLLLPLLQLMTGFVNEPELDGDVTITECPQWNWQAWWSGEWQRQTADCSRDRMGFFPSLVRSRNQLSWTLFRQPRSKNTLLGKDGFFYGISSTKSWTGERFRGQAHWNVLTHDIRELSDSLETRNKSLLVVLAPNKNSVYPEYTLTEDSPGLFDSTDHGAFRAELDRQGVNFIDFDAWFRQIRDQHECPLFLRGGIHWSEYGMKLGADSLYRKIEELTQHDLTDYELGPTEYYDEARGVDNDIIESLNLFFPPQPETSCSITFRWKERKKNRPNLLVMSDSFYSRLSGKNWRRTPFEISDFWYYNRTFYAHPIEKNQMGEEVNQAELSSYLQRYDLVVMMVGTGNLYRFDWGFANNALRSWPTKEISGQKTEE